jgi:hypothetical protein
MTIGKTGRASFAPTVVLWFLEAGSRVGARDDKRWASINTYLHFVNFFGYGLRKYLTAYGLSVFRCDSKRTNRDIDNFKLVKC